MPYKDPARQKAYMREYQKAYIPEWRAANPEKVKEHHLKTQRRRQGMTNVTAEKRHGDCPICLKTKALVWDHDHETGNRRGWICNTCNLGLGKLGDTIEALDRARVYLLAAPKE